MLEKLTVELCGSRPVLDTRKKRTNGETKQKTQACFENGRDEVTDHFGPQATAATKRREADHRHFCGVLRLPCD